MKSSSVLDPERVVDKKGKIIENFASEEGSSAANIF